jgi:hypothetical protein
VFPLALGVALGWLFHRRRKEVAEFRSGRATESPPR